MLKKIISIVLVIFCFFATTASAEGKLNVVQKNLIIDNYGYGYFFAKVKNGSTETVYAGDGNLVAFTEDDEILFAESYVTSLPYSIIMQPGEYAYVVEYIYEDALADTTVGDYKFSIDTQSSGQGGTWEACETSIEYTEGEPYDNYVYVTFTNTSNEAQDNFYIVIALYDADDTLIYVEGESIYDIALHSGSTITYRFSIDSDMCEYYDMNGCIPVTIDAKVYYLS